MTLGEKGLELEPYDSHGHNVSTGIVALLILPIIACG